MASLDDKINAVIAVGPTCRAQTKKVLSPHIKVQSSDPKCSSGMSFFAMAVLLDPSSGAVIEKQPLEGTNTQTGMLREDGFTMQFVFPNLAITAAGRYKMRLDVYSVNPSRGVDLEWQLETAEVFLHD